MAFKCTGGTRDNFHISLESVNKPVRQCTIKVSSDIRSGLEIEVAVLRDGDVGEALRLSTRCNFLAQCHMCYCTCGTGP